MIQNYIILFFIYSFMGWLMEVLTTRVTTGKWVNRGFTMGPICPIYGCGCLAIIIFLSRYYYEPITLFCMAIVICSLLEYFTSFAMEKIFKMRWWDYSDKKFNINGRICLETMLPFGILGTLMVYIVNPFYINLLNKINNNHLMIISFVLAVLFIMDLAISFNIILNLKNVTKNLKKDSTEEIVKIVKEKITKNKYLYNRVVKAFPHIKKIIKEKQKEFKDKIEKIKNVK